LPALPRSARRVASDAVWDTANRTRTYGTSPTSRANVCAAHNRAWVPRAASRGSRAPTRCTPFSGTNGHFGRLCWQTATVYHFNVPVHYIDAIHLCAVTHPDYAVNRYCYCRVIQCSTPTVGCSCPVAAHRADHLERDTGRNTYPRTRAKPAAARRLHVPTQVLTGPVPFRTGTQTRRLRRTTAPTAGREIPRDPIGDRVPRVPRDQAHPRPVDLR